MKAVIAEEIRKGMKKEEFGADTQQLIAKAVAQEVGRNMNEIAKPLMEQLAWPTIFCHDLEIDAEGRVANYRLRQPDQKRKAVAAFRSLNYRVIAAGDSYNDTTMLGEADTGFLFRSPDNVKAEFPQFRSAEEYDELMGLIRGELTG